MSSKQHTEVLGSMAIGRLLARIAIPSSLAMFVSSTYNLVDTIFVGRGVGPIAIGALTLIFTFQMFVMSFGNLIGIGAASIISRALGAGDNGRARSAAGTAITTSIVLGLLVSLVGSLFPQGVARILGATGDLEAPTVEYLRVILIAEPLLLFNLAANSIIRAEGQARVAMTTMVAGMLVNIGLDPLFIFVFEWGVRGAALATLIGHGLTTVLIAAFYIRGRGTVKLTLSSLRPVRSIIWETSKIGSSGFVRQISSSLVHGIRNNLLVLYGGTIFISAYGVVFRSILFLAMPVMGIAQSLPPIAGYNYGAGQMDRVRRAVWVSIISSSVLMSLGFIIMEVWPAPLFRLFSNDLEMITRGIPIMRVNAFAFLTFPAYFIGSSFYQAIGMPWRALLLSLSRPILATAAMLIGVQMFGALGVIGADPIAFAIGAVIVIFFLRGSFSGTGVLSRSFEPRT